MSNTIIFKDTKIWRKDYEGQNGTFYAYNISVSKKNQDNSWSNAYIKIKFSQSADAPEKISNGSVADFEGFLTVDTYKNKEGKEVNQPMIMVMKLNLHNDERYDYIDEVDSFEKAEEEIPF